MTKAKRGFDAVGAKQDRVRDAILNDWTGRKRWTCPKTAWKQAL